MAAGAGGAAAVLTDEYADAAGTGTGTGEVLSDDTQAVPVARATVRSAAVAPPSHIPEAPPNESRGARRRRLGIPRRITFRVVFFILLVAAIPVARVYAVRWYAYDNWFLAVQNNQIVVKQGHPAGVLWFHPRVVDKTKVTLSEVPPSGRPESGRSCRSPPAKQYVANLHDEYRKAQAAKKASQNGVSPGGGTTTRSASDRRRSPDRRRQLRRAA